VANLVKIVFTLL